MNSAIEEYGRALPQLLTTWWAARSEGKGHTWGEINRILHGWSLAELCRGEDCPGYTEEIFFLMQLATMRHQLEGE